MKMLGLFIGLLLAGQADAVKQEIAKLKGTWSVVSHEKANGTKSPEEEVKGIKLEFETEHLIVRIKDEVEKVSYKVDPTQKPPTIDLTDARGKQHKGIYLLEGDTLKLCISEKGVRPTEFKTDAETETELAVLRRDKK